MSDSPLPQPRISDLARVDGTPAYLAGPLLVTGAQDERGFARMFEEGRAARR